MNEPVAYLVKAPEGEYLAFKKSNNALMVNCTYIPLYTHPVKELTDFEIKGVLGLDECWIGEDCSIPDMIAFARAILRKAQEK